MKTGFSMLCWTKKDLSDENSIICDSLVPERGCTPSSSFVLLHFCFSKLSRQSPRIDSRGLRSEEEKLYIYRHTHTHMFERQRCSLPSIFSSGLLLLLYAERLRFSHL